MELSDAKTIADLLCAKDLEQRRRSAAPAKTISTSRHRQGSPDRCKCGICQRCQENARWDRIFQEKFADPDYYSPRPVRQGSPLW